jgi:hypothetical protein
MFEGFFSYLENQLRKLGVDAPGLVEDVVASFAALPAAAEAVEIELPSQGAPFQTQLQHGQPVNSWCSTDERSCLSDLLQPVFWQ